MPIKNVGVSDLALIELLSDGKTDAPRGVLAILRTKGYITGANSAIKLTAKGRDRAFGLKPAERDLRMMFGAGGMSGAGQAMKTVGGATMRG